MESNVGSKVIIKYRDNNYDITEFIHKHPGGVNTLKGFTNADITKRFLSGPPHSDAAMYLMNEYKIRENKIKNGHKNGIKNSEVIKEVTVNGTISNGSINGLTNKSNSNIQNNENFKNADVDESMEHLVDWSKPMLSQISSIEENYDEWVHKPVDRPLRLFGPWYLEMLTKTPWWVVPVFWLPNIFYILYSEIFSTKNSSLSNIGFFFYFATGVFFWTLIEYVLHRWVFHIKVAPGHRKLCIFHFLLHGLHHKVPFDPYRLVFPPIPAIIIASVLYLPVIALFPYPRTVLSGGLLGYLCYDMMHYYLHYGNPKLWHIYQMKRYHYQHHFAHQDIGFGITSPLWDFVFSSRIYLRRLKFKIKW